jgi:hypothetical protein
VSIPTKVLKNIARVLVENSDIDSAKKILKDIQNISGLNGGVKSVFELAHPYVEKLENQLGENQNV